MQTDQLISCFNELFAAHPDFAQINRTHDTLRFLQQECRRIEQATEILPLLDPIRNESRATLDTGLFCAWFSLSLARQLRVPESTLRFAFQAGLVQDIGLLRSRAEAGNRLPQTAAGLRAFERHPLVSCRILEQVPGVPTEIIAAVREHHEMADGSGFPVGLHGSEGSSVGRILSTSNAFWGYRMRRKGFTLGHVKPICQFSHSQSFSPECRAALDLIRSANLGASRRFQDSEIPELIARMLGRVELLRKWHRLAQLAALEFEQVQDALSARICKLVDRIDKGVESSGILTEAMMRWAMHVVTTAHTASYAEMEELEALHNELNAQLHLVKCLLEIANGEPDVHTASLAGHIEKMSDVQQALPSAPGYTLQINPGAGTV